MQFDNLNLEECIDKIKKMSKQGRFSYVVTPNVDHVARLCHKKADEKLAHVYQEADLTLCDSRILNILLRIKGKGLREVVPGSTLTKKLFEEGVDKEDKVLVFGVDSYYIDQLRSLFPYLDINHINPTMGFINRPDEVDELVNQVEMLQPNYIFLSVGSPRQEIFVKALKDKGTIKAVSLCVGASVLFITGAEKRAPKWLQVLHMEWFYRMIQDPKRLFMRYFRNFLQLPSVFRFL